MTANIVADNDVCLNSPKKYLRSEILRIIAGNKPQLALNLKNNNYQ